MWREEEHSQEGQEQQLQPVLQAEEVPLEAGEHLEELPEDEAAEDDHEDGPETAGAEQEEQEAEEEQEELQAGGEDRGDDVSTSLAGAVSLEVPGLILFKKKFSSKNFFLVLVLDNHLTICLQIVIKLLQNKSKLETGQGSI